MDKDTWKQIEDLFHQALERPVASRKDFVTAATQDDPQLRFEVMTLLSSHASGGELLESPSHLSDAVSSLADQIARGDSSIQTAMKPKRDSQTAELSSNPDSGDAKLIAMIEASRKDFIVKRSINRGGMGVVFRVYQRKLDRDVAVKVLSASHLDDRMRRRFIRESKAVAQVQNDHVVRIYEVCQDQDIPFLVMELIEGPSLKRFIELNRRLSPKVAAELARQIAIGLHAAHKKNLIHRDIKPANVLLEPLDQSHEYNANSNVVDSGTASNLAFRARVIDFGLARDIDNPTGETQDQLFAGTLSYMSPEQIVSPATVDRRSDIYSLGMTLYQMLTGEKPFHGAPHMVMQKIQKSEPTTPRKLDDRIPRDLESICLKSLQKDRERRYQSAQELSDDLQRFLDDLPTKARPISSVEKITRWIARNRRVAALAGLAAGLLIALTVSALIFAFTVQMKDQEIIRQTQLAKSSQLGRIIDSDPAALPYILADTTPDDEKLLKSLNEIYLDAEVDFNSRLNAAVALSHLGQPKTDFIVENLNQVFISPPLCQNLVAALKSDPQATTTLRRSLQRQTDIEKQARQVIVLAMLGDFQKWEQASKEPLNLSLCTEIIHQFKNWHGDLVEFSKKLSQEQNEDLDWTFSHALSLIDARSLNANSLTAVSDWLSRQTASRSHVHSASARQALKNLRREELILPPAVDPDGWYENKIGGKMIRIEAATSTMGRLESAKLARGYPPHEVTITQPFYIADAEVTVRQFEEYLEDTVEPADGKQTQWENSVVVSPTADHPVNLVSYYDAARFCNWLSRREGLTPVYRFTPGKLMIQLTGGETTEIENWETNRNANGYRLPTEHEWELACRDGTTTRFYYGTQAKYFPSYGLSSNHTRIPTDPIRSRLPNRLGLFDMTGNLWELCDDWHAFLDESSLVDPVGPDRPDPEYLARVHRGGGVSSQSGDSDAEARGGSPPGARYNNVGFRIARNAD